MTLRIPPRAAALGRGRRMSPIVVLTVAATAWVGLALSDAHSQAPHGHHVGAPVTAATTVISLAGWTLMVLAMMLPPALPLVGLLGGLLPRQGRLAWRLVLALAAFVGVWFAVGVVLVTGDAVLTWVIGDALATRRRTVLAGTVVLVAALYQFTPIKNACLTACRSPRWFALRLWGRKGPALDAAAVAGAYGISCVGCCWALMLLCLGTGALALPVMVVLAVVMAAERLVPHGVLVARLSGLALALLGAALLAGLLPPSLLHPLLGA